MIAFCSEAETIEHKLKVDVQGLASYHTWHAGFLSGGGIWPP